MKKLFALVAMVMVASVAFAATTATGTNTVAPTLQISATIQKAVSLTLATGTSSPVPCTVTAGGSTDYAMNFGTVDALGISAGNCNMFPPTTPGTTNAIYWSDYQLKPVFTSQSATTNTITAQVTTGFGGSNIFVVRDAADSGAAPAGVGAFTAMGTGAADTIVTNAASGSTNVRLLGVAITPASGAGVVSGAQTATVTFTLTVI